MCAKEGIGKYDMWYGVLCKAVMSSCMSAGSFAPMQAIDDAALAARGEHSKLLFAARLHHFDLWNMRAALELLHYTKCVHMSTITEED